MAAPRIETPLQIARDQVTYGGWLYGKKPSKVHPAPGVLDGLGNSSGNKNTIRPLETECKVSGILSFSLHLSRLAGVAPLSFESVRDGWSVRASGFYTLYSYAIVIIFLFLTFASTFWFDTKTRSMLEICEFILVGIVNIPLVYTGHNRMRNMIDCIAHLEQINKELDRYHDLPPQREGKKWFATIIWLFFGYFSVALDYGTHLNELIIENGVQFISCAPHVYFILCLQLQMFTIHFTLVVMRIVSTLQRINTCLNAMFRDIYNDTSSSSTTMNLKTILFNKGNQINVFNRVTNCSINRVIDLLPTIVKVGLKTSPETFNQLSVLYCSVCDIIRQLNESNGIALLMMLLFTMMYMMIAPYHAFSVVYLCKSELPIFKVLSYAVWAIFFFCMLTMTIECCNRTHSELHKINEIIKQMKRYTQPDAHAIGFELKMFGRHILLNHVSFSPLQILTLSKSLLATIMTTVFTYLTFFVNYKRNNS